MKGMLTRSVIPRPQGPQAGTTDHPVCAICPHLSACVTSRWNEYGNPIPLPERMLTDNGKYIAVEINSVYTCRICYEHVLTTSDEREPKQVVPDACPRWNAVSGSAWACPECVRQGARWVGKPPVWS